MPRVTDAHKSARRQQILDGARECFARNGFQATTIRQLERQTGLSSGAMFNYFATKADMFIALAEQDAQHLAALWTAGGLRAVVMDAARGPGGYRASYLEVGRELLTDENFRRRWEQRGQTVITAIRDRLQAGQDADTIRTDLTLDELVTYSVIQLDGINLQIRLGAPTNELLPTVDIYEASLRHPATAPTPA